MIKQIHIFDGEEHRWIDDPESVRLAALPKPHLPVIDRDAPPGECELYILKLRQDRIVAELEMAEGA